MYLPWLPQLWQSLNKFCERVLEIFWNEVLRIIKRVKLHAIHTISWYFKKMISFENVAWSHYGMIPLHTKNEGNCSGRSRARRILLTCIQLLLLQLLLVIWSMPTNFALFKKPLDKFCYKLDICEISCQ